MITLPELGACIPEDLATKIIMWAIERHKEDVVPPPLVKILTIVSYLKQYQYKFFVETGTFLGDTTDSIARIGGRFGMHAITIELADQLYDNAVKRFADRPNIECLHGDSGALMPQVVERLTSPAIFWLDGHYSGGMTACGETETPVMQELETIFASPIKNHLILVDDVRLFGTGGYPTVAAVEALAREALPESRVVVSNDILRIEPPLAA